MPDGTSLLSLLDPLSGGGLAVGIAYLNLERFRYRGKVRNYARQQLKTINPEQEANKSGDNGQEKKPKVALPGWLMDMETCKELHRIAALPDHDAVGNDPDESDKTCPIDENVPLLGKWAGTYSMLFEHHRDRKITIFLTVIAGAVLMIGSANDINAWSFLIPVFSLAPDHYPNAQTDVVFYLLVAAVIVPMVFVHLGNQVVIWGRERVRALVKDCRIALQRPAQEAAVNAANGPPQNPAPAIIPQPAPPALPAPGGQPQ